MIAAASLVALASLGGPAGAAGEGSATAAALKKSYCSPTGDYCINVFGKKPGKIRLVLASFSFDGGYELCVDPPRGDEECKTFTLKPEEFALYGSVVKWRAEFDDNGAGIYRVRWRYLDAQLGPRLAFKLDS